LKSSKPCRSPGFFHTFWWIFGWFLVDVWLIFGWFLVDFWGWWWVGPLKNQKDLGLYKFFQYGWLGGG
jgi:hypothetical protein